MSSATVRIRPKALEALRALAAETGEPMSEILEKALEQYRRQRMFEEANAAWAKMRANPKAWAAELEERGRWEATLADGLDDEVPGK